MDDGYPWQNFQFILHKLRQYTKARKIVPEILFPLGQFNFKKTIHGLFELDLGVNWTGRICISVNRPDRWTTLQERWADHSKSKIRLAWQRYGTGFASLVPNGKTNKSKQVAVWTQRISGPEFGGGGILRFWTKPVLLWESKVCLFLPSGKLVILTTIGRTWGIWVWFGIFAMSPASKSLWSPWSSFFTPRTVITT